MKLQTLFAILLVAPVIAMAGIRPEHAELANPLPDADGQSGVVDSASRRSGTEVDAQGRIIRQADASGTVSQYVYHPKSGKLILVLSDELNTQFNYDERGNLTRAANSKGRVIDLEYAGTDLIQGMVERDGIDHRRRELRFKYNADGRPTEITMVGTGKIIVAYDDEGEISKVESKQGVKMALQVTRFFQDLLSVVKVAGAHC
jgi:YD repeat-containing protein